MKKGEGEKNPFVIDMLQILLQGISGVSWVEAAQYFLEIELSFDTHI